MPQIAIHFREKGKYAPYIDGRKQKKVDGYQLTKTNYRILKLALGELVADIPKAAIVHYRYITLPESERWQRQGNYVLTDVDDAILAQIAAVTKTTKQPRVYLWRDEQWWSFPQLEEFRDGEMQTVTMTSGDMFGNVQETREFQIEKTKTRLRETYEPTAGPGFQLATTATDDTNPAGFPLTIAGNGMVLEWKRGYDDKPPTWWLRDEKRVSKANSQTYQHYATIKATPHARWSRGFSAWYFTGGPHPPQSWLDLVGYDTTPVMSAAVSQQLEAERQREIAAKRVHAEQLQAFQQFQAALELQRRFAERHQHLSQYKALPAMATPPLDDPWS